MSRRFLLRALAGSLLAAWSSFAIPLTPAPKGAEAYIIWPGDGAVIDGGKLWVRMGLKGMGVCPKGVERPNCGHHHLLIDAKAIVPAGAVVPTDANHMHFGKAQTQADIKLAPGKHTLQLELGDKNHMAFDPPVVSKKITVNVE